MKDITDRIYMDDCIKVMQNLPTECIDLVFADPPYNLDKQYEQYDDSIQDEQYLEWSYSWLNELCRILKPTGSLYILNLPKWSIYYANHLDKKLYRQSCIVWDALSSPRGKIMPAHYTLLYYTKKPNDYTYNKIFLRNSYLFCFSNKCKEKRQKDTTLEKIPLDDLWYDIPRIKHKKDRDKHPCQLPIRLLERIVYISSNVNDYVFDPFLGIGTTAIVAKLLNRHYSGCEIDPEYFNICENNIENVDGFKDQLQLLPINQKLDDYF